MIPKRRQPKFGPFWKLSDPQKKGPVADLLSECQRPSLRVPHTEEVSLALEQAEHGLESGTGVRTPISGQISEDGDQVFLEGHPLPRRPIPALREAGNCSSGCRGPFRARAAEVLDLVRSRADRRRIRGSRDGAADLVALQIARPGRPHPDDSTARRRGESRPGRASSSRPASRPSRAIGTADDSGKGSRPGAAAAPTRPPARSHCSRIVAATAGSWTRLQVGLGQLSGIGVEGRQGSVGLQALAIAGQGHIAR